MRIRSYEGEADVARLQRFNAESIAATGGCGYLHPGDIVHHLFYGNKAFDPADLATIWEDATGVAAWVRVMRNLLSSPEDARGTSRESKGGWTMPAQWIP